MSIEQQLDEINANLRAIAALLRNPPAAGTPAPAQPEPEKAAAPAKTTAKPAAAKVAAPQPAAAPEEIDNDRMSDVTVQLLTKCGRDATVKLLASFGAAKATQVAPADRPKYVAEAQALIAAV